ncbi:MAG: pyrroline-5-carboxylate reductase [Acidobacteria bacterium]|nr:pyrroline-5-carboxylate reductase [Acidobacteriota bacterium]
MADSPRIAVLGAGNMGEALVAGMLRTGVTPPNKIIATVRTQQRAEAVALRHGIRVLAGANLEAAENSDIIIAAVKPAVLSRVLEEIRWGLREGKILISIAASVPIAVIEKLVSRPLPIFRAMPNTPVTTAEGATCIAANRAARPEHGAAVERIFKSVGQVWHVAEDDLHAVTALSGAGPAYICTVIEALTAAALKAGLPRDIAPALACQTVLGSAKLVRETGTHPAVLRDQVITPGGVTIAGLHELERHSIRSAFITAVEAATARSREITDTIAGALEQSGE